MYWYTASKSQSGEVPKGKLDEPFRSLPLAQLAAIGITSEPPDPASLFEEFGAGQLSKGFLSGAVEPITSRGMIAMLLASLSDEALMLVSDIFALIGLPVKDGDMPTRVAALNALAATPSDSLDPFTTEPIVAINPSATARQVGDAVNLLLTQWKDDRNLGAQRVRVGNFDEYFEVWDYREGFRDGRYHASEEHTLQETGEHSKRGLQTVASQYYSFQPNHGPWLFSAPVVGSVWCTQLVHSNSPL